MAYHDIGYVGLDELLALGADVRAVVTHRPGAAFVLVERLLLSC